MSTIAMGRNRNIMATDDEYPVSEKARERISRSRIHDLMFRVSSILAHGGFTPDEVDSIVKVMVPLLEDRHPVSAGLITSKLREKGFNKTDAETLGRALAPSD
ncbi:MAG: hypothetical protein U1E56_11390 [Bauldia sp.]